MRRRYQFACVVFAFCLSPALADTLTLKNGSVVEGTYLGGTARLIRMAVGDGVQSFSIDNVAGLQFGGGDGGSRSSSQTRSDDSRPSLRRASPAPDGDRPVLIRPDADASPSRSASGPDRSDPDRPVLRRADSSGSSSSSASSGDRPVLIRPDADVSSSTTASNSGSGASQGIQIPSGTAVTVRMIDSVDSQVAHLGDTFRASVDEPVNVNGQVLIPRGADVTAKLVEDQQSGKIAGKTILKLALSSIKIGDRNVEVTTQDVAKESDSRGARSAKVIGGATALGAIIGGIAGGGKGAAIGAGSGAAVGTGTEELGKGQRVRVPSETRLVFTLSYPVNL